MSTIDITFSGESDLSGLIPDGKQFIKRLERRVAREVIPPVERYLDRLIDQLMSEQPPRRTRNSPPFVWSLNPLKNARGRAGFFARYPNGYTRTGRMARAWTGSVEYREGAVAVSLVNPSAGASYVYGAPQWNYEQVPGHVTTGWYNAGRRGQDVVLDAVIEFDQQLEAVLDAELTK